MRIPHLPCGIHTHGYGDICARICLPVSVTLLKKSKETHTHIEEYYGQRWLDTDSKHEYVSMPEKFITRMWNPHIEQCRAHLCPGCLRPGYFPIDRTDFVYDLNNSKWGVIQNWRREREGDLNAVEGVHGGASLSCFFLSLKITVSSAWRGGGGWPQESLN